MVTFISDPSISLAATLPIIDGVPLEPENITENDLNDYWDRCNIVVNLDAMSDLSIDQRKEVIIHEIGHALKLCHDREIYEELNTSRQPLYKSTYPSVMHPISDINGVNYLHAQQHISSWITTNFNRESLISKWGN